MSGDDRRILRGSKFFIPGYFWVGKWVPAFSRDFLGIDPRTVGAADKFGM